MGPSAIRYAGLVDRIRSLGLEVSDLGDVGVAVPEAVAAGDERARFLPQILETCEHVAELVADAATEGRIPLVLGGDHSIALGSLAGMARVRGVGGVLWVDAHADMNTPETSPSGNVHGMPLAAALGLADSWFERPAWPIPAVERAALVGVRSVDVGERELIRSLGIKVFTMADIDKLGIEHVLRESLEYLAGSRFVHVSLDLDAVDPDAAPGVGTPVRGGLSYREAHLAMELIAESELMDSLDVVEVNPILDRENETGKLAVELVASALGARIL
jgi:arginase